MNGAQCFGCLATTDDSEGWGSFTHPITNGTFTVYLCPGCTGAVSGLLELRRVRCIPNDSGESPKP